MINALASFHSGEIEITPNPKNPISEVFLSHNSLNKAVYINETILLDLLRHDLYIKFAYVMFCVV